MKEDWTQLKQEYVSERRLTLRALAQKHSISYERVAKRSASEGWAKLKRQRQREADANANALAIQARQLSQTPALTQADKINRIAGKLLNNIEQGTEIFEKPSHIATLTAALKELTAILRDVNEVPTQKQRRQYELEQKKLELADRKLSPPEKEEGGVVILAQVNDNE